MYSVDLFNTISHTKVASELISLGFPLFSSRSNSISTNIPMITTDVKNNIGIPEADPFLI